MSRLGIGLVVAGLVANPWVLGALFSPDGSVGDGTNRALILLFEAGLVGIGLLVLARVRLARALLRAGKARPRATAAGIGLGAGLVLLAAVLVGVEAGLRLFSGPPAPDPDPYHNDGITDEELYAPDSALGYVPLPSRSGRVSYIVEGDTAYSVVYRFDEHARRITPIAEGAAPDRFALFFGCSFCFGQGVEERETMPAAFARGAPRYRPYNDAYSGYGPQAMLARLTRTDWTAGIGESSGVAVYVFWDSHLERANGTYEIAKGHGRDFRYCVERDGRFVWGRFPEVHPRLARLYDFLEASPIARSLEIGWPPFPGHQPCGLTARIVAASRDAFLRRYPEGLFVTVIHPGCEEGRRLVPHLVKRGVTVLDYADLVPLDQEPYFIPIDLHPSAATHAAVGARLARDIDSLVAASARR